MSIENNSPKINLTTSTNTQNSKIEGVKSPIIGGSGTIKNVQISPELSKKNEISSVQNGALNQVSKGYKNVEDALRYFDNQVKENDTDAQKILDTYHKTRLVNEAARKNPVTSPKPPETPTISRHTEGPLKGRLIAPLSLTESRNERKAINESKLQIDESQKQIEKSQDTAKKAVDYFKNDFEAKFDPEAKRILEKYQQTRDVNAAVRENRTILPARGELKAELPLARFTERPLAGKLVPPPSLNTFQPKTIDAESAKEIKAEATENKAGKVALSRLEKFQQINQFTTKDIDAARMKFLKESNIQGLKDIKIMPMAKVLSTSTALISMTFKSLYKKLRGLSKGEINPAPTTTKDYVINEVKKNEIQFLKDVVKLQSNINSLRVKAGSDPKDDRMIEFCNRLEQPLIHILQTGVRLQLWNGDESNIKTNYEDPKNMNEYLDIIGDYAKTLQSLSKEQASFVKDTRYSKDANMQSVDLLSGAPAQRLTRFLMPLLELNKLLPAEKQVNLSVIKSNLENMNTTFGIPPAA